jgi:hypothetical protein
LTRRCPTRTSLTIPTVSSSWKNYDHWLSVQWTDVNGNGSIYVVPVNALQYGANVPLTPTTEIAEKIQETLDTINNTLVNLQNAIVVVNMSFAILPCNIGTHFAKASATVNGSFVQYMQQMILDDPPTPTPCPTNAPTPTPCPPALPPSPLWDQAALDMITPSAGAGDPLLSFANRFASCEYLPPPLDHPSPTSPDDMTSAFEVFMRPLAFPQAALLAQEEDPCAKYNAIYFVAAAGNTSLPFPFYPAASEPIICTWDEFDPIDTPDVFNTDYSNSCQRWRDTANGRAYSSDANDMSPYFGGYYALIDPWMINAGNIMDTNGESAVAYLGTSFVAPSESAFIAIAETNRP